MVKFKNALFAAGLVFVAMPAVAQSNYPNRTVTVICTYAAGGGGDLVVRKYAAELKGRSGQTFIVENRVGANGHIGNRAAMEAKPDGYTILITGSSAFVGNPLIMKDANYNPLDALASVATLADIGLILVVDAKSDVKSVADLSTKLKAKKGDARYGAATVSQRMISPWYLQQADATATEVGYRATADAVNDMTAGLLDFVFADATLALAQAAQGRVRMLATTTKKRVSFAPELPTMDESGLSGMAYSVVWAAWVPKDTPPAVINQLHNWFNSSTNSAEIKAFLNQAGAEPMPLPSPAAMNELVADQYELWKHLVANAKIEKQ